MYENVNNYQKGTELYLYKIFLNKTFDHQNKLEAAIISTRFNQKSNKTNIINTKNGNLKTIIGTVHYRRKFSLVQAKLIGTICYCLYFL